MADKHAFQNTISENHIIFWADKVLPKYAFIKDISKGTTKEFAYENAV